MKTLLTGAFNYTSKQIESLQNEGMEVVFVQQENNPLTIKTNHFEAVVCNNLFLHNNIDRFKSLRIIQLLSSGTEKVPHEHIKRNKILLFAASGVYSVPMAEWIVGKILEFYKHSKYFFKMQNQGCWQKNRNLLELSGKMAIIVGFGKVGQETAKRLLAFNVNIAAIDKQNNIADELLKGIKVYKQEELNPLLPNADILILSLPLTEETKGFIGSQQLSLMKENSVLVNVSRGGVLSQKALLMHLRNGKFFGVALDVFEQEPLPADSPLWGIERAIITPHNSFVSEQVSARMFDLIFTNLKKARADIIGTES